MGGVVSIIILTGLWQTMVDARLQLFEPMVRPCCLLPTPCITETESLLNNTAWPMAISESFLKHSRSFTNSCPVHRAQLRHAHDKMVSDVPRTSLRPVGFHGMTYSCITLADNIGELE